MVPIFFRSGAGCDLPVIEASGHIQLGRDQDIVLNSLGDAVYNAIEWLSGLRWQ